VWHVATNTCTQTFDDHNDRVLSVALSPIANRIATGAKNGDLNVYDSRAGTLLKSFKTGGQISSTCFSPNGKLLAYVSYTSVHIVDLSRGVNVYTFAGDYLPVSSLAFSPDGASIIADSGDFSVKLWNLGNTEETENAQASQSDYINSISILPDDTIRSTSNQGTIQLWNPSNGSCTFKFKTPSTYLPLTCTTTGTSSSGHKLVAFGFDTEIEIWIIEPPCRYRMLKGKDKLKHIAFSPDCSHLVSIHDSGLYLWTVNHREVVASHEQSLASQNCWQVKFEGDIINVYFGSPSLPGTTRRWKVVTSMWNRVELRELLETVPKPPAYLPQYTISREDPAWLVNDTGARVCWIPVACRWYPELKPPPTATKDHRFFIGTRDGKVAVLDFSRTPEVVSAKFRVIIRLNSFDRT
jgi:WD40 repeat protein